MRVASRTAQLRSMFLAVAFIIASPVQGQSAQEAARRPVIPPAATVLTLTGLNFNLTNYVPRQFGGMFSRPPYDLHEVRYPASIAPRSIDQGVAALDAALHATRGPVIVLAHSQGAQVASRWMREHTGDPQAPSTARVTFILTGNPLRATGGYAIGRREIGGAVGLPTPTTPWHVIDVARRYDGWADPPDDEGNALARRNALAGRRLFHPHYEGVDLYDPANTVWKSGTTTFVLTREDLPIWRSRPPLSEERRRAEMAEVEAAYSSSRHPH